MKMEAKPAKSKKKDPAVAPRVTFCAGTIIQCLGCNPEMLIEIHWGMGDYHKKTCGKRNAKRFGVRRLDAALVAGDMSPGLKATS